MKKITRALLAAAAAITLTGGLWSVPAGAAAPNWKASYKEYIKQMMKSDNGHLNSQDAEVVLVDLNRDGVPELIAGESYRTVNTVVAAVTFRNGKVVKLQQSGDGQGEESPINFNLGMSAFSVKSNNLKLYKISKTGEYIYIGEDGGSSAISWSGGDYAIRMNGTSLLSTEISTFSGSDDEGNEYENYSFNKKTVSKKDYDRLQKTYYAKMKEVKSGAVSVRPQDSYDFEQEKANVAGIERFLNSFKPF
ncbi:hypothetical protein J7E73_27075 [Paenibacillus albidus]|uniref:hypothetical protein n=1 Tax=Paenibacillus albidus TaxID=2041023 RepID=UPI001BE8FB0F|nr:hypothetical protein [Paenibacillus albidus]MBT2292728.1 hypothetical protein [Paenibacillus albidus]